MDLISFFVSNVFGYLTKAFKSRAAFKAALGERSNSIIALFDYNQTAVQSTSNEILSDTEQQLKEQTAQKNRVAIIIALVLFFIAVVVAYFITKKAE